jgi:hypothetical protein
VVGEIALGEIEIEVGEKVCTRRNNLISEKQLFLKKRKKKAPYNLSKHKYKPPKIPFITQRPVQRQKCTSESVHSSSTRMLD